MRKSKEILIMKSWPHQYPSWLPFAVRSLEKGRPEGAKLIVNGEHFRAFTVPTDLLRFGLSPDLVEEVEEMTLVFREKR